MYDRKSQVGCQAASRASFAPTGTAHTSLMGVWPQEPGRLSGRFASKLCRSEEHTSELQSLMRISYAVFCLKKKNKTHITTTLITHSNITTKHTNKTYMQQLLVQRL